MNMSKVLEHYKLFVKCKNCDIFNDESVCEKINRALINLSTNKLRESQTISQFRNEI